MMPFGFQKVLDHYDYNCICSKYAELVLNMTCPKYNCICPKITVFVLNMTVFVLNMTVFVLNMTVFVLTMIGFVLIMTVVVLILNDKCDQNYIFLNPDFLFY